MARLLEGLDRELRVPVMLAFILLETTPFSTLGFAILIAVVPLTFLIGSVFRRLGVIADRRHAP